MAVIPIVERVLELCTNGTIHDVVLNKRVPGETYTWHEITGVNRSGQTDTIEVGLKHIGEFFCYRSAAPPDKDRAVRLQTHIIAPGEFVPCARFRGAGVGHTLELVVNGHDGHI